MRKGTADIGGLRALRRARGLSQRELAQRAGVGLRTVRALEAGEISRPQQASLDRVSDALDLQGAERRAFLRAWADRQLTRTVGEQFAASPARDIDSVLTDEEWCDSKQHVLYRNVELTVDEQHRIACIADERVLQLLDGGANHRWTVFSNSGDVDGRRIAVTDVVGATPVDRVILQVGDEELTAVRWQLPDANPGDYLRYSMTFDMTAAQQPRASDETTWFHGVRRAPDLLVVALRFAGPVPTGVWEYDGPDSAGLERGRKLPVDGGIVTRILRAPGPGLVGFGWDW